MSIVTIIGSGMMGSALAFPAMQNGNEVRLVGTPFDRDIINAVKISNRHPKFDKDFPKGLKAYQIESVNEALVNADLIICGVSSFGVVWFADNILPILPDDVPVISVTKGLMNDENGDLHTYPDIWQNKLNAIGKHNDLCAIGGPCTSYELVFGDQTIVAFCGKNIDTLKKIKNIMATDNYHVITTTDMRGVEAAVALKNGYALAVALTIGCVNKMTGKPDELHYNSQAAAFLQATKEMHKLVRYLGGTDDSFYVGIGDLYVTVYGGRTRKIGILLGEGKSMEEALSILEGVTLESLVVAKRVAEAIRKKASLGELDPSDFPLLLHVDDVVSNNAKVNIPWSSFTDNI